MHAATVLMLGSGVFWVLTYALIIKRGFQDRVFGMPLVAICANVSWEFIFAFVYPHVVPYIYTNIAWLFLDAIILFQLLKFGRSEFAGLSGRQFYLMFLLAMVTAFCAVLFVTHEFDDQYHGAYAAFGQNLMMSVLFISMIHRRGDLRGQSMYIAFFKMLGTVLASLSFYLFTPPKFEGSSLMPFLYVATFVFDLIYIGLVYLKCREQSIVAWKRL